MFLIEKYYTHYKNWEDWQNGMYEDSKNKKLDIENAVKCLRNPYKAMLSVTKEWKYSSRENLSDLSSNRRSWLGQASCCYECKVPESCTREAWGMLTKEERINANKILEEKFKQKINQKISDLNLDPARIAQEVVFLLDRADISEEIVRLKEHLDIFFQNTQKDIHLNLKHYR